MSEKPEERKKVEIAPGVYMIPGAAPETGTELTRERMSENMRNLQRPWSKDYTKELEARVEQLEGALRFYAERSHYHAHRSVDDGAMVYPPRSDISQDGGEIARAALSSEAKGE